MSGRGRPRNRRAVTWTLVAAAPLVLLVGCRDGSSSDSGGDTTTTLVVETEKPIKADGTDIQYNGTAIVFDHLLEVFDRGVTSAAGGIMK